MNSPRITKDLKIEDGGLTPIQKKIFKEKTPRGKSAKPKKYKKRSTESRTPNRWQGDENEKLLLLIAYNREYIKEKISSKSSMKNQPKVATEYFCKGGVERGFDVIRVHFHKMLPEIDPQTNLAKPKEKGTMLAKMQQLVSVLLNLGNDGCINQMPKSNVYDKIKAPSKDEEETLIDKIIVLDSYFGQIHEEAEIDRKIKLNQDTYRSKGVEEKDLCFGDMEEQSFGDPKKFTDKAILENFYIIHKKMREQGANHERFMKFYKRNYDKFSDSDREDQMFFLGNVGEYCQAKAEKCIKFFSNTALLKTNLKQRRKLKQNEADPDLQKVLIPEDSAKLEDENADGEKNGEISSEIAKKSCQSKSIKKKKTKTKPKKRFSKKK